MIKTENVNINGRLLTHTWSDERRYIIRDGIEYEEAWDPAEFHRTYTEGNPIPEPEPEEIEE